MENTPDWNLAFKHLAHQSAKPGLSMLITVENKYIQGDNGISRKGSRLTIIYLVCN